MSRHSVDPELAAGPASPLSVALGAESRSSDRATRLEMVAAIFKPTPDARRAVQTKERPIPAPPMRALVASPSECSAEPMLDHRSLDSDHPHAGRPGWTRERNRFDWSSMLADKPPGLPAAFNHIGAIDLFLEEAVEYARRPMRAGVPVELPVWPGAYQAVGAVDSQVSRETRRIARTARRRALNGA